MHTIGTVNWIGLLTLYMREVRRFFKVYMQTLVAPIGTTLLFLAIFSLALGRATQVVGGVPFIEFLAPGLVMMALTQNAFANSSSSIIIAKIQGSIIDTLMPPLTAHELTFSIAFGGATRGLLVGILCMLAMMPFVSIQIYNPWFVIYHAVAASIMLSLIGTISGIWAEKIDHVAFVTNFLVTPLSFLSGTFYSIERLPESIQLVSFVNPFFYMIDGFRYGFIGHADGSLTIGIFVTLGVDIALWMWCHWMFKSGYNLKS
ncbi:MAG: ABC transporter permease [Rhodospirillaceae bacterium]|jgi:ABC-2 type transport system permease protein|nr:ABC transporter permease [Rhodospirillaceae bacterium]